MNADDPINAFIAETKFKLNERTRGDEGPRSVKRQTAVFTYYD